MDAAAELDAWLQKHVAEPRRTLAREAASNLSDFATCEEADLEDVLQISTWPPLARSRFLRAWRKLKGDEAGVTTVATQTDIVGPVVPVAAAAEPTGSSSAAAAADDDDFEASSDDDDSDGGARNGPKRRRGGATSRFVGVSKQRNKWAVRYADRQGNRHTVGTYDDEETAALKFNEAIIAAKLTDIRAINPVVDGRPQPKQLPRDKSAARPPDPQRVKTTGSSSQYYGPYWDSRRRRWQAKLSDAAEKTVWTGTYNDEETAAREYHAAVHRFGLQAIRKTSVDASGALVPKPKLSPKKSPPHLKPAAASSSPLPPKAKSPAPAPAPAPPAPVPPPRVVVTRKPMPAARPPAPPPKQKFVVRVPPPKASPAAAPQPKKPSPPPRPRTPPLEAFRKHAGPDGDRKAAVAAFFAAQRSDEAPPPKKRRTDDDAIGDGEVLSEMF
ncbi:unnamed protein product [Pelagomonas calceolata]|uniref:AP2/ERF domain-containing protein n=1 Tax=Pelagomonas calceolata TaxID=35677 RepID=A0A8J2SUK5_9STRA|nr:unnamed protein product [Pelagomonas calceolata]